MTYGVFPRYEASSKYFCKHQNPAYFATDVTTKSMLGPQWIDKSGLVHGTRQCECCGVPFYTVLGESQVGCGTIIQINCDSCAPWKFIK